MKILIDINENDYIAISHYNPDSKFLNKIISAIKNGTEIPKRNGRILIVSEKTVKDNLIPLNFSNLKWINEVNLSSATIMILEE